MRLPMALLLALQSVSPAMAQPHELHVSHCGLSLPADWTQQDAGKATNADKSISVALDETDDGTASLNLDKSNGADVAQDSPGRQILTLSRAGVTRYLAVAPPSAAAACRAQFSAQGSKASDAALSVAKTLRRIP